MTGPVTIPRLMAPQELSFFFGYRIVVPIEEFFGRVLPLAVNLLFALKGELLTSANRKPRSITFGVLRNRYRSLSCQSQ